LGEVHDLLKIRINGDKAMDVYISMANAPLTANFKKDKSSEKKLKGKDRKLATDLSDTVDYYLYPKLFAANNGGNGEKNMKIETL